MNTVIKRAWNKNKLVKVEDLTGMTFQAESGGHTFEISGVDDTGAAVSLSGTVEGRFLRADNAEIIISGTVSGGEASVTLSADCYAIPGRFLLTIYVTSGGQKVAVYAATGSVVATSGTASGSIPPLVTDSVQANTGTFGSISTGDATVNGVLNVTQLIGVAQLSTAGWYRLTSCSLSGSVIHVSVVVGSAQTIDFIVYLVSSTTVKIVYDSVSVSIAFDGIRVNLGDGKFHIDLHKAGGSTLYARVDLLPSGNSKSAGNLTQAGFSAVSDSPASETELAYIAVSKNVPISSPKSLLASGEIANSTTFTYTATEPCWFYYVPVLQAGSSGSFEVQLNGVVLAAYTSGEAIGVNVAAIPVPMQTGDVLYITQSSNRTSSYRVLTMKNVSIRR